MLSVEQTTIRRLDNEIAELKKENEKLRAYKKDIQTSFLALLKKLLPALPANCRSTAYEQIAELEEILK